MKTSSKLTIAALLLILIAIVLYDLMLRDTYLSGTYKDPFREFKSLNFRDFNTIDLNASTAANIIVKQGPFSVRIDKVADPLVKVKQNGKTLSIDAAFPGSYENSRAEYVLVITCPDLKQFNSDARYMADDMLITDTLGSEDLKWRPTIIQGFTLDSLSITEKHASSVILQGNKIGKMKAVIGLSDGSRSNLVILRDNEFKQAETTLLNKSQLKLNEAYIQDFKYHLADSSRIIVTGAANKLLNR